MVVRNLLAFLALTGILGAQEASGGASPVWDVKTMCAEVAAQVKRLEPLLGQVNPGTWATGGDAYGPQVQSLKKEAGYIGQNLGELAVKPDSMTKTLEAFLRLRALDSMTLSLIEGVRRHQNPAVADLLQGVLNEVGPYAQALQEYLVELVALKESELRLLDAEAQKCRASLIRGK